MQALARPTTWREFVDLTKTTYSKKVALLDGIPEVIGSLAVMLSYNNVVAEQGGEFWVDAYAIPVGLG